MRFNHVALPVSPVCILCIEFKWFTSSTTLSILLSTHNHCSVGTVNTMRLCMKCISNTFLTTNSLYLSNSILVAHTFRRFSALQPKERCGEEMHQPKSLSELPTNMPNDSKLDNDDSFSLTGLSSSVTDVCNEDISTIAPYLSPTFNFAAYVNQSPTLQQLVKLGVDLNRLEKKKDVPEFILRLDFERDMKQHLRFLHDVGVPADQLGYFLTKNPMIFKEDIDDLAVRINYLESKRFTPGMIATVVQRNPYWLNFSTSHIDSRLGFFQSTFKLSGNEVRTITVKKPRLITYSLHHVKVQTFSIKEEMGFSDNEIHTLIVKEPSLWTKCTKNVLQAFLYAHNEMKLTHEQLSAFPEIMKSRPFRIKQRHLFLKSLGRAQYDPKLEGYVSPEKLVRGTDTEFCKNVAKTSVETFNIFLKSL